MFRKFAWSLVLLLPMLFWAGCGSSEVEYPDNPTPPPQGDPTTTGVSAPDAS